MTRAADALLAPVPIGEVVDKITILRIKRAEISDPAKLANVVAELDALDAAYRAHVGAVPNAVLALTEALLGVNRRLWTIEDDIRDCERRQDFGSAFVALARAVYVTNDERARLKREISVALGSALVEEKSYADYAADSAAPSAT